jgi:hypothetical protein
MSRAVARCRESSREWGIDRDGWRRFATCDLRYRAAVGRVWTEECGGSRPRPCRLRCRLRTERASRRPGRTRGLRPTCDAACRMHSPSRTVDHDRELCRVRGTRRAIHPGRGSRRAGVIESCPTLPSWAVRSASRAPGSPSPSCSTTSQPGSPRRRSPRATPRSSWMTCALRSGTRPSSPTRS